MTKDFAFRTTESKLEEVNEHRKALGRRPFGKDMASHLVDKHHALVQEHAPYGNDPWATNKDDRTGPPR